MTIKIIEVTGDQQLFWADGPKPVFDLSFNPPVNFDGNTMVVLRSKKD